MRGDPHRPGHGRDSGPPSSSRPGSPAGNGNGDPAEAAVLRDRLQKVRERFAAAATATGAITAALSEGRRPGDAETAALTAAVRAFDDLHQTLSALGEPPAEPSLEGLSRAVEAAARRLERSAAVRALTTLTGPSALDELLAEIRHLAETGRHEGLPELAELIELCRRGDTDPRALERIDRLAQTLRELLPERHRPVVMAAIGGHLSVSTPEHAAPSRAAAQDGADLPQDPAPGSAEEEDAKENDVPVPVIPPPRPAPDEPPLDDLDELLIADAERRAARRQASAEEPPQDETAPTPDDAPASPEESASASDPRSRHATASHSAPAPQEEQEPSRKPESSNRTTPQSALKAVQEPKPHDEPTAHRAPQRPDARRKPALDGRAAPPSRSPVMQEASERRGEPATRGKAAAQSDPGRQTPQGGSLPGGGDAAECGRARGEVDAARLAAAEAAALRSGRPALAGWLRAAAGRPEAEVRARHAAAIALETTEFAGRMSAAYAQLAHGLAGEALEEDPAGQLLAWASAIRSGIVQPTGQSDELLRRPPAAVSARPALAALGEAFLQAGAEGVYLQPGISNRLGDVPRAEERRAELAGRARRMLAEVPARKIKYQRATEVLKLILHEDGEIGRLLAIAAADDAERADQVRQGVDALRADGVDRLIDAVTRSLGGQGVKRRIEAGARRKLRELLEEGLDVANRWSGAVREQTAAAGAGPQQGPETHLAALQRTAGELGERCLAELEQIAAGGDQVLTAAAQEARRLLTDTLELLRMRPLGAEPHRVDLVLCRDLPAAPGIALAAGSLEPAQPPAPADLVALAESEPDWEAAFQARAERGDHIGTAAIVEVLGGDRRADELRRRRAELVAQSRDAQRARVEKLRDQLARLRRDGVLGERDATRLEGRLQPLAETDRADFDRMGRRLEEIEGELAELVEREVAKVRRELAAELHRPAVAGAAERIGEYLDSGDLTTAREFLVQAKQGRPLPEAPAEPGDFARFFPAFPRVFDALRPRQGRRAADPNPALDVLIEALQGDGHVADERLAELLAEAGLDLAASQRRDVGAEALRRWRMAGGGPKTAGNLKTMIEPILRLIGLEGEQHPGGSAKGRTWIELSGVRRHGQALLPAFGSRMSPSGDTLRLLLVWNRPHPQQLVDLMGDEPRDQTVLVWYFGTLSVEDRRALAEAVRRRPHPVAVLDDAAIGYLACRPGADWSTTVALLAPFTAGNPFVSTGDVPEEMFYGRAEQLQQVIDRSGGSIVYGGRQLGKSALLQAARRQVTDSDPHRKVIFKSISDVGRTAPASAIWPTLRRGLEEAGIDVGEPAGAGGPEPIRQAVRRWLDGDPRRQLLILLDEADEFLNRDAEGARFANVGALRDLMSETERRVKVVFAGLHQTARFKGLSNQPLGNLGRPISVGPLAPQDAFDLLTRPLAALGFRVPQTLAARIIAKANNAPALIQLFADALLRHLRSRPVGEHALPYEVTRDDIDAVWADARLAEGFRERFEWTINLDQRYKVIAYTIALNARDEDGEQGMPVGALYEECRDIWWPQGFADCSLDAFCGLLEESVELGVLIRDGDRYRLRTPYILELLGGAEQVEQVLTRAQELELPDSFDVHSYRPAYGAGPERSPLTGGQISRLLTRANLVHVIAGSGALQLERVPMALQAEEERHEDVTVVPVRSDGLTFDDAVRDARDRPGHTLVVVGLRGRTLAQARRQIRDACQIISRHRGRNDGTLAVVFTAPPALAPLWLAVRESGGPEPLPELGGRAELMQLRRFDAAAVRQWMREAAHAFQNRRGQEELLACTGGWPMLISIVLGGDMVADQQQALERCRRHLRDRPADLVEAAGVRCCPPVAAAWRELVDLAGSGSPADLADLLAPSDLEEDHPLSPRSLHQHGYRTVDDVIEVLRILGALVPAPHAPHELQCEPVLAEATRNSGEVR